MSKSAMIGGRVEQSTKDKLVGMKDVLQRKTRLAISETGILESLIERADVRELIQWFKLNP